MDTAVSRAKEAWLEPLQPTVRQGVVQMKGFITKLIDIEEKEGKDLPTQSCPRPVCKFPDPAYRPPNGTK